MAVSEDSHVSPSGNIHVSIRARRERLWRLLVHIKMRSRKVIGPLGPVYHVKGSDRGVGAFDLAGSESDSLDACAITTSGEVVDVVPNSGVVPSSKSWGRSSPHMLHSWQ